VFENYVIDDVGRIVLGILKTKILVDLLIMLVLEWSTFVAAQSDSWVLSWSVPGPEGMFPPVLHLRTVYMSFK